MVLAVTGTIAVLAFSAISYTEKTRKQDLTASAMAAAEQSIRAFVSRENRLPCPDAAGQGYEGLNAVGVCPAVETSQYGGLPYIALNMDRPVLSEGEILRYGVAPGLAFRTEPDFNLLDAAFGIPTKSLDVDGRQRFIAQLIALPQSGDRRAQTMLAGLDSTGAALNCSGGEFPAFALSSVFLPRSAWCFSDAPNGGARALSVSKHELLGWFQAQLP